MKKILCCWMFGACLIGCAGNPQAANPDTQPAKNQPAVVYFSGEGSDRDVRRFHKFLEIALDDYGMVLTDSSKKTDATVNVRIKREDGSDHLYTPLLWVTLTADNGKQLVSKSCGGVSTSDSIFKQRITYVPIELPENWTKEHAHFAVYLNDSEFKGFEDLLPALKQGLTDKNFRLVKTRAEADGEVKGIKIQKLAIPMVTKNLEIEFEVLDKDFNRFFYTTGKGRTNVTYAGTQPSIKVENIPCQETIEHFGDNNDDGFWSEAHEIAKTIQEHINKKAAHSN